MSCPATSLDDVLDALELLATHILPAETPLLVGVLPDEEYACRTIQPGPHGALDSLIGFEAPPDWLGIGVIVQVVGERPGFAEQRALVLYTVSRDGQSAWRALDSDGPNSQVDFDGPLHGLLVDACARAIGLPSSSAAPSMLEWLTVMWLDEIVRSRTDPDIPSRPPEWRALARLHPVNLVLPTGIKPALRPEQLVAEAREMADEMSWKRLHQLFAHGASGIAGLDITEIRWMDAPMFARWLIASRPDLVDLEATVPDLLPPELADVVAGVVAAWELPR